MKRCRYGQREERIEPTALATLTTSLARRVSAIKARITHINARPAGARFSRDRRRLPRLRMLDTIRRPFAQLAMVTGAPIPSVFVLLNRGSRFSLLALDLPRFGRPAAENADAALLKAMRRLPGDGPCMTLT